MEGLVQLAYLAVQSVHVDEDELQAARRRALLLLASGGDPRRELRLDSRAVEALAADLDSPERRAQLRAALEGLQANAAALLADDDLAWRTAACALLAEELGE
ncbi:MAG: hypothetical protein WD689_07090 [Gaiellaceae bacterium]